MSDPGPHKFRRTREDHRAESAEDYVELVDSLIQETGQARVSEMARRLGVSQVTVSKTVKRLVKEGYLDTAPYRPVELTAAGKQLALRAQTRHETVVRFLLSLGVGAEVAETDAEGIEHHVSPVTLDAMNRWIRSR
ncbi:MAG: manganese-binding transcriptional regulator MntR [Armatimonadetes bacterium]|nr:manganese-binding transcriptional regulator MntR [Armatimonadota bacterium]